MKNEIEKCDITLNSEQRIINHLILNSHLMKDLGLYEGKMGIIIFFMHLAKNTKNNIYEDVAIQLIDEIWDEIDNNLTISMSHGLSGIGLGIEYLLHYKFVEGNSLNICEELDNKIMSWDPRRISDYSVNNGIGGLLHYILAHVQACMGQNNVIPFDDTYLNDFYCAINRISKNDLNDRVYQLVIQYNKFFKNRHIPNYSFNLEYLISSIKRFNKDNFLTYLCG